jgi:tetratricopeptide (TPR) repeat protein
MMQRMVKTLNYRVIRILKKTSFGILIFFTLHLVPSCIEVRPSTGEKNISSSLQQSNSVAVSNEENRVEQVDQQTKQEYLSTQDLERRRQKLEDAERDYNLDPENEENIIWYGRRLAYLGRYQEAITVFTDGLTKFPQSFKLYRHRGHRYITTRQFDLAIEDLQNAAFYSSNIPNEIEPDGIPNALNKPLSNVKWNIWYHLGLAYYMKGNYDKAISSYKKCLEFSNNNDLDVKTHNWLYVTYRKIGNTDAADALAAVIPSRIRLVETRIYHDLIMLYRGFVTPEVLIRRNTNKGELEANVGYGIGNWYLMEGQVERAIQIFNRILEGSQKDSFGYIAIEVEMTTLSNSSL